MGGKPAIIANKINTTFYDGENYLEVNVDISSSTVAKNILRVVKSYAKKIVFDLAWGFEGKVVEHLPEYVCPHSLFVSLSLQLLTFVVVLCLCLCLGEWYNTTNLQTDSGNHAV